ncbi:MAG: glycosyltransferase [Fusobacterium necrophorum]|nr:glycosyltransferase [Fusobacterium necrophorum]
MKNINLKINPYFWFNKKNLIYLRSLIPLSSNNEYAIKLINDRIEVLENILEQSSFLEKKINESYLEIDLSNLNLEDLINLLTENLKINYKKISAVIIVFNEERCINRCITSLINKVDEIIILDTGSTDNTINFIKKYNSHIIKLYNYNWNYNFSEARNFAKSKATNEWIFFIDADEYLDSSSNIKLLLNSFNNIPIINSLVISPKIINHNEHTIISVKRIFTQKSNIEFFGKIHEEPRKDISKLGKDLFHLSLNIVINHDGYLPNIIESKNKLKRNLDLLEEMLVVEPTNPRWSYFLVRDGLEVIELDKLENLIYNSILIDSNSQISIKNLKYHEFTFALLDILARIKLITKDFYLLEIIINILNDLIPQNSNSFYYSIISKFIKIKESTQLLLNETINYRNNNINIQPGMLHSNGYHIDFLIALLLFETGKYKSSFKYFDFLEDKFTDIGIIQNYKQILTLKDYIK